jgi:hypothetical protein
MNSTLSETYFLAARARSKLTREASRQDHDLRVLVSHANLLDNLMDSLAKQRAAQKAQYAKAEPKVSFAIPQPHREPDVQVIQEEDEYEEEYDPEYEESSSDEDSEEEYEEDEEEDKFYEITHLHETGLKPMAILDEFAVEENEVDEHEEEDEDKMISPTDSLPPLSYSSGEESDEEESVVSGRSVVDLDDSLVALDRKAQLGITVQVA